MIRKYVYHVVSAAVLYACGKLAVRKRSCPSFSVHEVAVLPEPPAVPEDIDIESTPFYWLAALYHYWLVAVLRQRIRRKKPARTHAHYYDRLIQWYAAGGHLAYFPCLRLAYRGQAAL